MLTLSGPHMTMLQSHMSLLLDASDKPLAAEAAENLDVQDAAMFHSAQPLKVAAPRPGSGSGLP